MNKLLLPDEDNIWVYDLEVFPNFFFASAFNGDKWFEEDSPLRFEKWVKDKSRVLVGFNNFSYDDVISRFIVENPTCSREDIFKLSLLIIENGRHNTVFKMQYAKTPWNFSVDVFQLLNKKGALKEWQCRNGANRVVEAAYDFTKPLPSKGIPQIKDYCRNDVAETFNLATKNWHLATLRAGLIKQYGLGERPYVLSEAGVAQHTLMTLNNQRTSQWNSRVKQAAKENRDNQKLEWEMKDIVFPFVEFQTEPFQDMFERFMNCSVKSKDPKGKKWQLSDPTFKEFIKIGQKEYQLGVGGLHSNDDPGVWHSNDRKVVIDLDVEAYYPSIMIEHKLTPRHLGAGFIKDFTAIRDKRLAAKHSGDKGTNEALKIVINSTFGKLNDFYSPLRSVPDAHRVTINGQLMLLMLIEMLEMKGFKTLSANTDGVTIISLVGTNYNLALEKVVKRWEKITRFKLEQKTYERYCRRDINCYYALTTDGKIKEKGAFTEHPDKGKWDGMVSKKAAREYLLRDIDPKDTVYAETDPRQFLYYQRVQNGGYAALGKQKIGKTIRWYVAKKGAQVKRVNPPHQKIKEVKLPHGENAQLALDITDWDILGIPCDVDREYYVQQAWDLINTTNPKGTK